MKTYHTLVGVYVYGKTYATKTLVMSSAIQSKVLVSNISLINKYTHVQHDITTSYVHFVLKVVYIYTYI